MFGLTGGRRLRMSWCRVFRLGDRGSPVMWTTRTGVSDRPCLEVAL